MAQIDLKVQELQRIKQQLNAPGSLGRIAADKLLKITHEVREEFDSKYPANGLGVLTPDTMLIRRRADWMKSLVGRGETESSVNRQVQAICTRMVSEKETKVISMCEEVALIEVWMDRNPDDTELWMMKVQAKFAAKYGRVDPLTTSSRDFIHERGLMKELLKCGETALTIDRRVQAVKTTILTECLLLQRLRDLRTEHSAEAVGAELEEEERKAAARAAKKREKKREKKARQRARKQAKKQEKEAAAEAVATQEHEEECALECVLDAAYAVDLAAKGSAVEMPGEVPFPGSLRDVRSQIMLREVALLDVKQAEIEELMLLLVGPGPQQHIRDSLAKIDREVRVAYPENEDCISASSILNSRRMSAIAALVERGETEESIRFEVETMCTTMTHEAKKEKAKQIMHVRLLEADYVLSKSKREQIKRSVELEAIQRLESAEAVGAELEEEEREAAARAAKKREKKREKKARQKARKQAKKQEKEAAAEAVAIQEHEAECAAATRAELLAEAAAASRVEEEAAARLVATEARLVVAAAAEAEAAAALAQAEEVRIVEAAARADAAAALALALEEEEEEGGVFTEAEFNRHLRGLIGAPAAGSASLSSFASAATPAPPAVAAAKHVDEDETECVVCLDRTRTHAFVPCGHMCVCEECSAAVMDAAEQRCPVCRADVMMAMQMFF